MKQKQSAVPASTGVAAVWMGVLFGPGFASGALILTYGVRFGVWGIVCGVLSMCLLGYALYCAAEYARVYQTYSYADWTASVWGSRRMVPPLDLSFVIAMATALGSVLNTVGTLVCKQFFPSHEIAEIAGERIGQTVTYAAASNGALTSAPEYWVSLAAVILCAALLCALGARLVVRISPLVMFIAIALFAVILVMCAASGQLHPVQALTRIHEGGVEGIRPHFLGALWSGILYASAHAGAIGSVSAAATQLPNRSSARKAAVIGVCANSLILTALSFFLLSSAAIPGYTLMDLEANPLPFFTSLTALGQSNTRLLYVIAVCFAALSAAVSLCFGAVTRWSRLYRQSAERTPWKDAALAGVLLALCAFASKLGAVWLSRCFRILGYVNLPLLIFPAIVLAGRKISRKYISERRIDASGIDD